jgi:hypothetical protein
MSDPNLNHFGSKLWLFALTVLFVLALNLFMGCSAQPVLTDAEWHKQDDAIWARVETTELNTGFDSQRSYYENYCYYDYSSVDIDTGNYWKLLCRISKGQK